MFLDPHLLVVDKPAHLLSVPGRGTAGEHNLTTLLQRHWPDLRVVHRLDMATSGLICFARSLPMQIRMSAAFERRRVHKRYVAVVHGVLEHDEGRIEAPLGPDWPQRPRQIVDLRHGKPSLTHWRVVARDASQRRTRLMLEPITGRTHQLRVHLASIGHPILGDSLYGGSEEGARLQLHATALAFAHPALGHALSFESRVPF